MCGTATLSRPPHVQDRQEQSIGEAYLAHHFRMLLTVFEILLGMLLAQREIISETGHRPIPAVQAVIVVLEKMTYLHVQVSLPYQSRKSQAICLTLEVLSGPDRGK
jgi:hypothetical protein